MFAKYIEDAEKSKERRARAKENRKLRILEKSKASAPLIGYVTLPDEEIAKKKEAAEKAAQFRAWARDEAELVRLRKEKGYFRRGEKFLSGRRCKWEVRGDGLKSEQLYLKGKRHSTTQVRSRAAKLFPALVPRRPRSSWDHVLGPKTRKLFALDDPYIEANRKFLAILRIDADLIWPSVEACREAFIQAARDGLVACPPHFLVGMVLDDGRFIRPQALWLLPYGSAVWNDMSNSKCREAPIRLFRNTYYGMVKNLLHLGADAEAPWQTARMKNPLSFEWHTECVQDNAFPSLSELSECVDLRTNRQKVARISASMLSGIEIKESNKLFNELQCGAFKFLATLHERRDREYLDECRKPQRGRLTDRVHEHLERVVVLDPKLRRKHSEEAIAELIHKVSDYAAHNWDPEKRSRRSKNVGACIHEINRYSSTAEKQAVGAAYAARAKADRSMAAISAALQVIQDEGAELTKKSIAERAGVSVKTIRNRWSEIEELLAHSPRAKHIQPVEPNSRKAMAENSAEREKPPEPTATETSPPDQGEVSDWWARYLSDTYDDSDGNDQEEPYLEEEFS